MSSVVAVIRSYNNPAVVKQIKALRSFIGLIIVVTDAQKDRGTTSAWLKELGDPCVELIEMQEGYTWSNALNRAIDRINLINAERELSCNSRFDTIFNVSVEAMFKKSQVEEMLSHFEERGVGVVGTTFDGICDGNRVDLGLSYIHPRNTGMLIRLSAFECRMTRDFDSFCDDIGGMEDIDFICRLEIFTGMRSKMVNLKVPLIVGRHYNQLDKEKRERAAMELIFERYRKWSNAIFDVVRRYG